MAKIRVLNSVGATVIIDGVERESVTVDAGTTVHWSVSKEGYVPQKGDYEVWGDTVLPVVLKREEYEITFDIMPANATLNVNGTEYAPVDGKVEIAAKWGDTVSWSCHKDGYVSQSNSFTATQSETIYITLEEEVVARTITFVVTPTDATLTVNGLHAILTDGKYVVTAYNGDVIAWSCERSGYVTQSGNHIVNGDATITVELEEEVVENPDRTITFNVTPTDATLTVNGEEVTLTDGVYVMTAKDGDEIKWMCEKDGYISQDWKHTVDGDATITIALEEVVVEDPDRTITFIVSPTDSTIEVNGFIYQQDVDTGILEMRVKDGTVLEWSVYKDNYVTQSGSHTVDGDDTIEVTLESSSIGGIPPVSGEDSNITFDPEHPDNGATFKMTIEGSLATLLAWIDGYTPASGEQVVFVIDGTSYILYGEDNKTSIMLSVGEHTCSVTHSYTSVSSLSYPYKLCVSLSGTTYVLSVGTFNVGGMNNSDGTESYSGDSDTQPASDTEAYSEGEGNENDKE